MRALALTLIAAAIAAAPSVRAQAGDGDQREVQQTERARLAVERALEYLASRQEANGAWKGDVGYKLNYTYQYTDRNADHVGITSLSCMAFLAAGHLPGRGRYGAQVERGLNYILSCVDKTGLITDNNSRMYSHAFATLFLAEVFGATSSRRVQRALKKAVRFIVVQQNEQGGWRYAPGAEDSDMSIVVCQVQALRAARNVGIAVPIHTIRKAQDYVRKSARPGGSFKYQISTTHSRDSFALAAAGVTALQGTAIYTDRMVKAGLEYMMRVRHREIYGTYFYYYGHYYAVQAMYVGGLKWPHYWRAWYPQIREELISRQDPRTGKWHNTVGPGDSLSTAMGALILQIPYRYLPIFQR